MKGLLTIKIIVLTATVCTYCGLFFGIIYFGFWILKGFGVIGVIGV